MKPHSSTLMTLNGVQNEFLPESVRRIAASRDPTASCA